MFRLFTLHIISLFLVSISPAQNDDFEDRIDQTTDNIEKFVDGIVERIESQVDRMVDERSQRIEYRDDERDQDQDKQKQKISDDAITFNGNTEIVENDTVQGDLVVKNGTLVVRGTVAGDVLVVNGDIELKQTSRILGNVRAMNGSISKDDGAFVEGFTEQSSSSSSKKFRRKKLYPDQCCENRDSAGWICGRLHCISSGAIFIDRHHSASSKRTIALVSIISERHIFFWHFARICVDGCPFDCDSWLDFSEDLFSVKQTGAINTRVCAPLFFDAWDDRKCENRMRCRFASP